MGYELKLQFEMTVDELKAEISAGHPVLLFYQAWTDEPVTPVSDWSKRWADGHYSVAIGFDDKNLYLMDPSWLGHYSYIPFAEFLYRWHDTDGNVPEGFNPTTAKSTPELQFVIERRAAYKSAAEAATIWADKAKADNAAEEKAKAAGGSATDAAKPASASAVIPDLATVFLQTGLSIWKSAGPKYVSTDVQYTA